MFGIFIPLFMYEMCLAQLFGGHFYHGTAF